MKIFNFWKKAKKRTKIENEVNYFDHKFEEYNWINKISSKDCSLAVTCHKTILCVSSDGKIFHSEPTENIDPLLIYQVKGGVWFLRENSSNKLEALVACHQEENFEFSYRKQPITINIGGSIEDGISFNYCDFNLSSGHDGKVGFNTKNLFSWENFALISKETFFWIKNAKKEVWIDCQTGKEVFFKGFEKKDRETFADFNFDIYNISGRPGPLLLAAKGENDVLIFDSFKRKRIISKLNPLVYFCVFGKDEYYKCAALAVASLKKFGLYSGKILLISDRSPEETLEFISPEFRDNVEVKFCSGESPIFERYKIYDHEIENYSPVIYLDTDIITGGNINNIIKDVLCSRQFCLYREANEPLKKINETEWVIGNNWHGAWMFGRNGEIGELDFWKATSGIMMFTDHQETRKIFEMICFVGRITRREEIDWFGDQPVMNYVLTQNENINISVLEGKSLNSGAVEQFLSNPDRILMHISLGVGYGSEKLPIMTSLFEELDKKHN